MFNDSVAPRPTRDPRVRWREGMKYGSFACFAAQYFRCSAVAQQHVGSQSRCVRPSPVRPSTCTLSLHLARLVRVSLCVVRLRAMERVVSCRRVAASNFLGHGHLERPVTSSGCIGLLPGSVGRRTRRRRVPTKMSTTMCRRRCLVDVETPSPFWLKPCFCLGPAPGSPSPHATPIGRRFGGDVGLQRIGAGQLARARARVGARMRSSCVALLPPPPSKWHLLPRIRAPPLSRLPLHTPPPHWTMQQ